MNVVVEEGTKDGWTYRKWKNGRCEAWKDVTDSSKTNLTTSYGSLYSLDQSGQSTKKNIDISLPFPDKNITYFNAFVKTRNPDFSCIVGIGTAFNSSHAYIRPYSYMSYPFDSLTFSCYAIYENVT